MDITGFRSRSTPKLMQAVSGVPPGFAVQRRHGSRKQPFPIAAKALLLLVLVGLAWVGIRRAGSKQADVGERGETLADHATASGGLAAAGSGQRAGSSSGSAASSQIAKASGRVEQALLARIERSMRLVPTYRGPGKAETWPFFGERATSRTLGACMAMQTAPCWRSLVCTPGSTGST